MKILKQISHSILLLWVWWLIVYAATNIDQFGSWDTLTTSRINEIVDKINNLEANTYTKTEVDSKITVAANNWMAFKEDFIADHTSWHTWEIENVIIWKPLLIALDTSYSNTTPIVRFYVSDGSDMLWWTTTYFHSLSARRNEWSNPWTALIIPNKTTVTIKTKATGNSNWVSRIIAYQ